MLLLVQQMFQGLSQDVASQLQRGLCGDVEGLASLVHSGVAGQRTARAILSLLGSEDGWKADDVEAAGPDAQHARRLRIVRAFVTGELAELSRLVRLQRRLGDADYRGLGAAWQALASGDCAGAVDAEVFRVGDAVSRIEAASLMALSAIEVGEVDAGVKHARRAVRMARSEGFVALEYLTSLILARARRNAGHPHLALRILMALDEVVPAPWQGWLGFEIALAGGSSPASAWPATRALQSTLANAPCDLDGLFAIWAREVLEVHSATLAPPRSPSAKLLNWIYGTVDRVPGSLTGLSLPAVDATGAERAGVYVRLGDGRPRRVLRRSVEQAASHPLAAHGLKQVRALTALVHLATAYPQGLSREELFQRTYGFPFEAATHDAVYRQLLSRARRLVPEQIELVRGEEKVQLLARGTAYLPDPRCAPELGELILQYLARQAGSASAAEVSTALGVARRTVQQSLKDLVEDGACDMVRQGRNVMYQLEDTTFWKPTLERLKPWGGA